MSESTLDPKQKLTQSEFAKLMSGPNHTVSQPGVNKLIRKRVLTPGADLGTWLLEYGRHMAEVAAGWKSEDGRDLIAERARLAARQSERIEMELKEKKGELISKKEIADALISIAATIRSKLLGIPSRFKSLFPQATARMVDVLDNLIRETLTELSHERFPAIVRGLAKQILSDVSSSAKTDSGRVGGRLPVSEPGEQR